MKAIISIMSSILFLLSCHTATAHATVIKQEVTTPVMMIEYIPSIYTRTDRIVWDKAEHKIVSYVDGHGGSRSELEPNQVYTPLLTVQNASDENVELTVTIKDERSSWHQKQQVTAEPGELYYFIADYCADNIETASEKAEIHSFRYMINEEELPGVTTLILYDSSPEDVLSFDGEMSEFIKLTKLDEMMLELEDGATIEKVFYDNGLYSPYPKEGETKIRITDPIEIAALWEAIQKIEIKDDKGQFLTDWYPTISFCTDYGSTYTVRFDHKMLYKSTSECYNLQNDSEFWDLLGKLYEKYTNE